MDKNHYLFSEMGSHDSLCRLGEQLGAHQSDSTLKLQPSSGEGMVRIIKPGTNDWFWAFDFQLVYDFEFRKVASEPSSTVLFTIFFFLNPDSLIIKKESISKAFPLQKGMNILVLSDPINVVLGIPAGKRFRAVYLPVTTDMLRQQNEYEKQVPTSLLINQARDLKPAVFFETTNAAEYRTLHSVHSGAVEEEPDEMALGGDLVILLSAFLRKLLSKPLNELQAGKFVYYEKMAEVEKFLQDHILKTLPPVEAIARQANMSVSTLKRHFKLLYGNSIYDYYLGLKMDFAKDLLLTTAYSVTEVAGQLGYVKVSNFIEIFRRFHGTSPGALKRSDQRKDK